MTDNSTEIEMRAALRDLGFGDGDYPMTALGGGVSCDVYAVDLPGRRVCAKRALPQLRVAADWRAPPERSAAEVAWIRLVADIDARLVPAILAEDRARHLFVMAYLPPERYPLWKALLSAGKIDAGFAARVGTELARIHAATAGLENVAHSFDNLAQFHALRIEPYLLFTAGRHPDVAPAIEAIAARLSASRVALMQGDISPKNILCGPEGPVFLDAETACYGDPAFDLAFCLNHLLLKSAWHPHDSAALAEAFAALSASYFARIDWEPAPDLEGRAIGLLAAFLLARIDGKSPVEYLVDAPKKDFVREAAKALLKGPPATLAELCNRFVSDLQRTI
jgi:aminoglycoside phosphotransferase (APT) family kinase protein